MPDETVNPASSEERRVSTQRVDQIKVPELSDSMRAAASAIASLVEDDWFWVQREQGEPDVIHFRTVSDVAVIWLLRGLEHDYSEVLRQLEIAREGLIRWKAIKADLMANPDSTMCFVDYCPEVDPYESAPVVQDPLDPCRTLEKNSYRIADIFIDRGVHSLPPPASGTRRRDGYDVHAEGVEAD